MGLLDAFRRDGTSMTRIERLLEEQNSLLRELLAVHGRVAQTRVAARIVPITPKTAKDVFQVTRQTVLEQEQARAATVNAPWRENGPDSAPTDAIPGSPSSAPAADAPPPS